VTHREEVVYIDGDWDDVTIEREILNARGYSLVVAGCTCDDDVVAVARSASAILNGTYRMGAELFQRLPALKAVVRGGTGYEKVDVDAATRAGVVVCNTINYGADEVANHAFAMLLALNRKLLPLNAAIRQGVRGPAAEMMPHTGRIAGETLGLVSFGAIAKAVALRARGFDMRVIAYDPYVQASAAKALGVELVDLDELLTKSDYVSVHTPLSDSTQGLLGPSQLALMKTSAHIVLTSRGGVVDEAALTNALRNGRIAGAGIDVWEKEPPSLDNPLLQMNNVIASMHIASYSQVSEPIRRRKRAESAADVLDGFMPYSLVNPDVLERVALLPRPSS
jgi:D-3-phosphoglycerate dehydrogenase / 2-oxoglutarate reductase